VCVDVTDEQYLSRRALCEVAGLPVVERDVRLIVSRF
jgi:hypothetical protein